MVFGQAIQVINLLPPPWNVVVWCILSLSAVAYVGMKTVFFVPQGHEALRLRFKKVVYKRGKPVVVAAGIRFVVPFTHSLKIVSTMPHPILLRSLTVAIGKYEVVKVRATVVFLIDNIYLVAYGSDDFRAQLSSASEDALLSAIMTARSTRYESIEGHFIDAILHTRRELGVSFGSLLITSIEPIGSVMIAESLQTRQTPLAD